jgi:hypothetical protein
MTVPYPGYRVVEKVYMKDKPGREGGEDALLLMA